MSDMEMAALVKEAQEFGRRRCLKLKEEFPDEWPEKINWGWIQQVEVVASLPHIATAVEELVGLAKEESAREAAKSKRKPRNSGA